MTDVRPADYVTRRVYTEKESKGERIRARARSLCCALHSGPCPCPGESVWRFGRFGNLTRSSTSQQAVPVQYCAVTRPRACTHTHNTREHILFYRCSARARARRHISVLRENENLRALLAFPSAPHVLFSSVCRSCTAGIDFTHTGQQHYYSVVVVVTAAAAAAVTRCSSSYAREKQQEKKKKKRYSFVRTYRVVKIIRLTAPPFHPDGPPFGNPYFSVDTGKWIPYH